MCGAKTILLWQILNGADKFIWIERLMPRVIYLVFAVVRACLPSLLLLTWLCTGAAQALDLPYRPKDGDKLGYSKEESIQRLDPEVRSFLDGVLRLYKEPGVFTNRREAFFALGTEPGWRRALNALLPFTPGGPFKQYAASKGVFSREGWHADYTYWKLDGNEYWRIAMSIEVSVAPVCIESRAVEGYLDLYLHSGLDGFVSPISPDRWNRHGVFGRPYGPELTAVTPRVIIRFSGGCLVGFELERLFNYLDVSDENVHN